jgi:hypothetical protein
MVEVVEPKNQEEVWQLVERRRIEADKRENKLHAEVANYRGFTEALIGVATSWESPRVREHDSFFFLDADDRPAVAGEFLPKGTTAITDHEEWKAFLDNREKMHKPWHASYDRVPINIHLVSLLEVKRQPCPRCSTMSPLVLHYSTKYDQDSDTTRPDLELICFKCSGRFFIKHLKK